MPDHPVLDEKRAVAFVGIGSTVVDTLRFAMEAQQAAANEGGCHRVSPTALSNQAVTSLRSSAVMSLMLPGGMAWLRPAWI